MSLPQAAASPAPLSLRAWRAAAGPGLARLSRWAALVYLATALPTVLFLTVLTPPFQSPDEPAHFQRAVSVLSGSIIAKRVDAVGQSGAVIPESVAGVAYAFLHLTGHPETKYSSEPVQDALAARWNRSDKAYSDFNNTAIYPPFFYLPVVGALWVGRSLDWTVMGSYRLARTVNGAVAVAVAALAIALAGRGRALLFVVLSLPTALDLFASTSQDALLIAGVGLAAGLCSRAAERPKAAGWPGRLAAALLLGAATAARPPYAAFLVALAPPRPARAGSPLRAALGRLWPVALALAVGLGWILLGAAPAQVPMRVGDNVSIPGQLSAIVHRPALFPCVLWHTLQVETSRDVADALGVLGWSDGPLPWWSHAAAVAALAVAALLAAGLPARPSTRAWGWAVAAAMVLAFVGVHGALYLSWTPVGSGVVEGFQGRYMLPVAALAAVALPMILAWRPRPPHPVEGRLDGLRALGWAALFAFAAVDGLWLPFAVFERYYA